MSIDPLAEPRTGEGWTKRQREVLDLLAAGKTNHEIADALGVSLDGAKWHLREILGKLGVSSREDAAAYWKRERGRKRPRPSLPRWGWALGIAGTTAAGVGGTVMVIAVALANVGLDESVDLTPSPAPTVTASPARAGYRVVPGDTCVAIASAHGITVESLRAENPAIDANCTNLSVDQLLALPSGVIARTSPAVPPGSPSPNPAPGCSGASLGTSALAPLHLADGSLVFAVAGPPGCDGVPMAVGIEAKSGGWLPITGNPATVTAGPQSTQRWIPVVRWSNWCTDAVPSLVVTDTLGGTSGSGAIEFPSCTDANAPSRLEAVAPPSLNGLTACDPAKLEIATSVVAAPPGIVVSIAIRSQESTPCLVDATATFIVGGPEGWLIAATPRGSPQLAPLGFVMMLNGRCGEDGTVPSRVTIAGRTIEGGDVPLPVQPCGPGETRLIPYSW